MYKVNDISLNCLLCNNAYKNVRGLSQHIIQTHNISTEDYYIKFYKQSDEGICLNCGKETEFLNLTNGYRIYCCRKCTDTSQIKQNLTKSVFKEKYGVESIFQLEGIHKKAIKESQSEQTKNKRNTTNLKRYGAINPYASTEIINKITKTKTKNGTRSSNEIIFENALKEKNIKYITDYKDNRYPYHCDFYLPNTDTFIELNIHWTHGFHFYDENNIDDINRLQYLQNKAKTSNYYQKAIDIWTKIDLAKLKYATENNLNYIVLWNKNDINTFIQNL